ncbi:MAG: NUDIX domain-containing protein [Candidatus Lokiarchaeota archaeon]|jgi:ADP-ribose pyrophosphatase YjhB (NUDIX family)|nr:NUDIX domain-containing protein [Candidatus Lokiarchaeota archaeon]
MDPEKLSVYDTRRYPVRPHVGVGVLLVRDDHLLLVKRKYNPDAGYWSIPGGHLDLGEQVRRAAEREALEETGFQVKVTKLAGIIDKIMYDDNGKIEYHYVLLNYFVEQIEGDENQKPIADDDALEAKFVPFEQLKEYRLTGSLVELLKELKIGFQ